ncbi:LemA family protein [Pseudonocardia sp. WMMC193]|nr:LemA family protein [Pseudonocardia sp. WMMC193]MCF7548061.1 LemA family protein [Pseudonocardia sp. WMMC193]
MSALIVVLVIVVVLILLAVLLIGMYNRLVTSRNAVDNAWAQIDVQLRRRHELIPNLVETVKGYAAHERQTLDAVTAARSAAVSATGPAAQAAAENRLTGALRSLFAVAEAYPQLQAGRNFADLQAELSDTENRIAYARQYYNDAVLGYNNAVQTVPTALVAGVTGFRVREYFTAPDEERGPVAVRFS